MPETPSNGGYMIAAYVLTSLIYLGYVAVLWARTKGVRSEKD
jgi:hypothetical protein